MPALRATLAAAMIVAGAVIVVRMLPYPFTASFTGIILGGAMIALGVVRLRAILGARRT